MFYRSINNTFINFFVGSDFKKKSIAKDCIYNVCENLIENNIPIKSVQNYNTINQLVAIHLLKLAGVSMKIIVIVILFL